MPRPHRRVVTQAFQHRTATAVPTTEHSEGGHKASRWRFMRLSPAECRLLSILTIYAEQRELDQVIAARSIRPRSRSGPACILSDSFFGSWLAWLGPHRRCGAIPDANHHLAEPRRWSSVYGDEGPTELTFRYRRSEFNRVPPVMRRAGESLIKAMRPLMGRIASARRTTLATRSMMLGAPTQGRQPFGGTPYDVYC